jgi:hypothetical protein
MLSISSVQNLSGNVACLMKENLPFIFHALHLMNYLADRVLHQHTAKHLLPEVKSSW